VFLVFFGMLLSVFCGRFRRSDQNVREQPTLSGQRLPGIPVLECICWLGTVVGVAAAVRSRRQVRWYASKHCVLFNVCTCISVFYFYSSICKLEDFRCLCLNTSCIFLIEWQKSELLFL
jgi:hypothetical protein